VVVDVDVVVLIGAVVVGVEVDIEVSGAASSDPHADVDATAMVAVTRSDAPIRARIRASLAGDRRGRPTASTVSGAGDAEWPRYARFASGPGDEFREVATNVTVVRSGDSSCVATPRPADGRTPC
jgi:hypothetical protein